MEAMTRVLDLADEQTGPDGFFPLALQVWSEAVLDPAIGAIVRARYLELRQPFLTIARRAVERGELGIGTDAEAMAAVLFGLIPGYALQRQLVGYPDKETYLAGVRTLLG
nr:hypothetical protein GCM10020092_010610 [Actinoplanes digitatis]